MGYQGGFTATYRFNYLLNVIASYESHRDGERFMHSLRSFGYATNIHLKNANEFALAISPSKSWNAATPKCSSKKRMFRCESFLKDPMSLGDVFQRFFCSYAQITLSVLFNYAIPWCLIFAASLWFVCLRDHLLRNLFLKIIEKKKALCINWAMSNYFLM